MNKKVEGKIEEAYEHIEPYLDDEECTEDLREMCKYCENYCGKKHNYKNCENMMCFKFYLAYEYLRWSSSYE